MKEIRGMKIIGKKLTPKEIVARVRIAGERLNLTPKEIAARVERIRVERCNPNTYAHWEIADIPSPITAKNTRKSNRPVGDCRHFFRYYREEYTPEQKKMLKKYKIALAKHLGTSRKKCPECNAKGHVQIWPMPFEERRLLCSQCGWTDGRTAEVLYSELE